MAIHLGLDISMNHGAAVALDDAGKVVDFAYYTDVAGSAVRSSKRGTRLVLPKTEDKHIFGIHRLAFVENWLDKKIFVPWKPDYVGIEDYAIRAEQGAHFLGEVGGIARILCWFRGFRFRLHDPTSVKMFIAHDGTAQKDAVEDAVRERWNIDFGDFNLETKPTPKNPTPKENRKTSEDLADAYGIAQMVRFEALLRLGKIRLEDFHEKEIRVFHRVTKAQPVNLLARDWIQNPEGTKTPHDEPVCATCGSRKCCLAKRPKKTKVA
jgi:hypothetical protein